MGSSPISGTIIIFKKIKFGGIAKWPNAADCKSVPSGSMVQIHLPPPLIIPSLIEGIQIDIAS